MSPASASCSTRCGSGVVGGASRAALTSTAGLLTAAPPGSLGRAGGEHAGRGRALLAGAQPLPVRGHHGGLLEGLVAVERSPSGSITPATPLRLLLGCVGGRVGRRVRPAVQQVVAQLGEPRRDHVDRRRGHHQQAEEAEHEQDRHGAVDGDRRLQRAGGEEADDAAAVAHPVGALRAGWGCRRRRGPGRRRRRRARRGRCRCASWPTSSCGARSRRMPRKSRASGTAYATRPKVPATTAWMTSPTHAVEGPPLAGGDDDRQADEGEADAVAAVLRLELAGAVPDLAHGAAGDVRHAHPGAPDGAQRQRQSPAAGLAAGGGLRGALGLRLAGRVAVPRGSGRAERVGRWTDVSPWSAGYAKATVDTRVTRVAGGNWPVEQLSAAAIGRTGDHPAGSSAISAGQEMQCRSPVPRWDCVWRGLRRRLRTARRRRRPGSPRRPAAGHRRAARPPPPRTPAMAPAGPRPGPGHLR